MVVPKVTAIDGFKLARVVVTEGLKLVESSDG
jgi:hypothetical protein